MARVRIQRRELAACFYCNGPVPFGVRHCSPECEADDRFAPERPSGMRKKAESDRSITPLMLHAVDVAKHMNAPELDEDDEPTVRIPRNWLETIRMRSVAR